MMVRLLWYALSILLVVGRHASLSQSRSYDESLRRARPPL